MSQQERVINFLKIKGDAGASSLEMAQRLYISSMHSVIRDIRDSESLKKKYGYETVTDEWRLTYRKEYNGAGKEIKIPVRYKQYFLKKMEGLDGD